VKVTSKGQVTIPIEIRDRLGLLPGTEVDFVVEGEGARILRRYSGGEGRGPMIVRRLRGTGSVEMTTNEILALTRKH
jgi:AbrB family looped-hinge helix DNA binding protein